MAIANHCKKLVNHCKLSGLDSIVVSTLPCELEDPSSIGTDKDIFVCATITPDALNRWQKILKLTIQPDFNTGTK